MVAVLFARVRIAFGLCDVRVCYFNFQKEERYATFRSRNGITHHYHLGQR